MDGSIPLEDKFSSFFKSVTIIACASVGLSFVCKNLLHNYLQIRSTVKEFFYPQYQVLFFTLISAISYFKNKDTYYAKEVSVQSKFNLIVAQYGITYPLFVITFLVPFYLQPIAFMIMVKLPLIDYCEKLINLNKLLLPTNFEEEAKQQII